MQLHSNTIENTLAALAASTRTKTEVNALLAAYGDYMGVSDLTFDETNSVQITIDEETMLDFIYQPHYAGVVMATEFNIPTDQTEAIAKAFLQANLDWSKTQGGSFARVPKTNQWILMQRLSFHDDNLARIDTDVARFVDLAQAWQTALDTFEVDQPKVSQISASFIRI